MLKMQNISKERTTHETEYVDETIRGHRGGTQFKISTELNFNKPKQPKKNALPNQKYKTHPYPYNIRPSLVSYPPPPIQKMQSYNPFQYSVNEYQYPYYSLPNPYYTNATEPSYLRYPYNYYATGYLEPEYQTNEDFYSDEEYSDEDESFFSKFAGLFKEKKNKKKKRRHSYY